MGRVTETRSAGIWAGVAVLWSIGVCWGALDGIPHVTDEVVYTLQARIFAHGARTAPAADVPSMLQYPFWVTGPEERAAFPFGWPLVLAFGELLGLAWLVNPLLAGVAVLLTFRVGRSVVGEQAAVYGTAVMACSPALVLLGASRMSHTSVMVGLLLGAWALAERGNAARWFLGGLGIGYAVLARPFDALLLGGPMLLAASWTLLRSRSWPALLAYVLPVGIAVMVFLADNAALQGHPLRFPADAFYATWTPDRPDCNRLGFGLDVGCVALDGTYGHTLSNALAQAFDRAVLLDRLFVGVPLVGVVAVVAALRRPLLLLPLLLVAAGHLLYWSPGLAYGPRFWALGVPGLALAVGALPWGDRGRWLPLGALVGAAVGLGSVWPELSDRYWCVDGRLQQYVHQLPDDRGVLFVHSKGQRATSWPSLGVEAFTCDPMLEFGDALQLWDPMNGPWQPRHALTDAAQTAEYRRRFSDGRPAFLVKHAVAADEREVVRLPPLPEDSTGP